MSSPIFFSRSALLRESPPPLTAIFVQIVKPFMNVSVASSVQNGLPNGQQDDSHSHTPEPAPVWNPEPLGQVNQWIPYPRCAPHGLMLRPGLDGWAGWPPCLHFYLSVYPFVCLPVYPFVHPRTHLYPRVPIPVPSLHPLLQITDKTPIKAVFEEIAHKLGKDTAQARMHARICPRMRSAHIFFLRVLCGGMRDRLFGALHTATGCTACGRTRARTHRYCWRPQTVNQAVCVCVCVWVCVRVCVVRVCVRRA